MPIFETSKPSSVFRYAAKRLILAGVTLLIVSVCMFSITKCAPTNPIEAQLNQQIQGLQSSTRPADEYRQAAIQLGLHIPSFYITIQPACWPDTIYRVYPFEARDQLKLLADQCADASVSTKWLKCTEESIRAAFTLPDSILPKEGKFVVAQLSQVVTPQEIDNVLLQIEAFRAQNPVIATIYSELRTQYAVFAAAAQRSKWVDRRPKLLWHGTQNQYHQWLSGIFRGDMGTSYVYRLPVHELVGRRLQRSIVLGFFSALIAFGIAIPLAVRHAGMYRDAQLNGTSIKIALFLYATPIFWLGSILILFFATPFAHMRIFNYDCGAYSGSSLGKWLSESWKCLILPILTMSIHICVAVYLQMRSSMAQVLSADYIRTARLKGLPERKVLWRHAFPNALFPLITTFSGILTHLIAGSVVIEHLFNIKGMGSELVEAYTQHDYPVLFAILMIYAVSIMIGNLIADLLYAYVDPRVQMSSR